MKKIIASALVGAGLLASAGSAQATTATAVSGLQFTSGGTCSVTGNVVQAGNFQATDTGATYAAKQGKMVGTTYTAGSATAATLATVSCSNGVLYSLTIGNSAGNNFGAPVFLNAGTTTIFTVYPYATQINGSAITGTQLTGDTLGHILSSTGTGSAQVVSGFYVMGDPTGAQLSATLAAGSYAGTATATVSY